jgi:lipoate-protein ligase A
LPFDVADGPHNMAADEVLLQAAITGVASLRFYGWVEPTVNLGYFQPERVRLEDPLLAGLPYVRRPSGGKMLVHHHEVTYAFALPEALAGPAWLGRMHDIIADALAALGVDVTAHADAPQELSPGPQCFGQLTAGDLLLGTAKVVGSAQRRQRRALLQHGAVLLAKSPHTPLLPGIREMAGRKLDVADVCEAIRRSFQRHMAWPVKPGPWTAAEHQAIGQLVESKYGQACWNGRR